MSQRITARGVNLDGDDQNGSRGTRWPGQTSLCIRNRRLTEEQLGQRLEYGQFGENLITEGTKVNDALVGERWEVGSTVLEVSEPREPC